MKGTDNMKLVKNNYAFVMKSIKKDRTLTPVRENLKNRTYIVAGGTRGIGYNIAKKLAMQGANVTILGKTQRKHPKLEGTIYTAAEQICEETKRVSCLGIPCDLRVMSDIENAFRETEDVFGSIHGAVINASALCLNNTMNQTEKEVTLMSGVNINGSFLFGKECFKHLRKVSDAQMLVIAPPLDMLYTDEWWVNHLYYSMSKFNMSLMAKYWNKEFPNVGVNTLWPRTTINTAPVRNLLGGEEMVNISRHPDVMGDAARIIFSADPAKCNGKNFIDDEVLASMDVNVEGYRVNKNITEKDLMPDFFC